MNSLLSSRSLFLRTGINYTNTQIRKLTVGETATALRPFFFLVHPDLFGKYPSQRAANEESLKKLNEFIANLHHNPENKRLSPLSLHFYIINRNNNKKNIGNLETVNISLPSSGIKDTVQTILRSCGLSEDYVTSRPERKVETKPDRPIKWHHSFYDFYGIPNPDRPKGPKKVQLETLSGWLRKNIHKAAAKIEGLKPIREQTCRMKKRIMETYELANIRWECDWGLAQFRAVLLGLERLLSAHPELNISGHSVVFGQESGVCLRGDIILRVDDVPDTWLKVLKSVGAYDGMLEVLPKRETELSSLLGGGQIIRRTKKPIILVQDYLAQLEAVTEAVRRFYETEGQTKLQGLEDLELVVECASGPVTISPEGQILLPSSCPGFLIVDFLSDNADKARQLLAQRHLCGHTERVLVDECKEAYGLDSLCRDDNIELDQMYHFCRHLLVDYKNVGVSLQGHSIRVAQFYSVMSDGEMYIPWDWTGVCDER